MLTKAPRYGSLPPCYGSIRHPHTRAENCCNDCPVEAPCDRLAEERGEHNRAIVDALEAENERLRAENAGLRAENAELFVLAHS